MDSNIENAQSIKTHPQDFGPKTTRLLLLAGDDIGLPVYGVSAHRLVALCEPSLDSGIQTLSEEIARTVPAPCIIRSSGLHEDGTEHAHAGEYRSIVADTNNDITRALTEVLNDAQKKLGKLSGFSLLIQPYKKPHYTGVFFSRDPRGGLLSMMAWSSGATPHVVSGSDSIECTFHRNKVHQLPFRWMHAIVATGLMLEEKYGQPQDIEWVYDGVRVYIVQTRPITTIPTELSKLYLILEKERPRNIYLERSGPAEAYPHPVPLTYSLLAYLYRSGGPIHDVYATHRIHTGTAPLLTRVGAYLYTDKEAELTNFYPSHSYFGGTKLKPHIARLSGLWKTFRTGMAFAQIQTDTSIYQKNREALDTALTLAEDADIKTWNELQVLLTNLYRVIFEINLVTFVAESKLKTHLKKNEMLIPLLLAELGAPLYPARTRYPHGNSLAIEDASLFTNPEKSSARSVIATAHTDATARRYAADLAQMLTLREAARCGSAWCAHHTRTVALHIADTCSIPPMLAPYMIFEELESGSAIESILRTRAEYHTAGIKITPPRVLTTCPTELETAVRIISHGYARGLVVDEEYLSKNVTVGKEYILYTPALAP